jgi:hypothetical protein
MKSTIVSSKAVEANLARISDIFGIDPDDPPLVGYVLVGFTTEPEDLLILSNTATREFLADKLDEAARAVEEAIK